MIPAVFPQIQQATHLSSGTIYVVDDDPAVLEAVDGMLTAAGHTVRTFLTGDEFLAADPDTADCVVLDVRIGRSHGLELQQRLHESAGDVPVVFISGGDDIDAAVAAMKGGAVDFVRKPIHADKLLRSIEAALQRGAAVREQRMTVERCRSLHATLTDRERQVVEHVIAGRLNKQIAYELGISEATVKIHRRNVMRKLGLRSVPELVRHCQFLDQ